jgi:hypothetical protein
VEHILAHDDHPLPFSQQHDPTAVMQQHKYITYLELPEFIQQRFMREVAHVLDVVVGLVLPRRLLLGVPGVDPLEDTQTPALGGREGREGGREEGE